ncbi:AAA family ATPase [Clostridium drakei]|uniref:AAA family ATPase n=1 Tax=Clostridium drakei TaxID=332101 RepID=A0A2U8DRM9_9CLOT|nr:AAA family ATPase [Clostridium drakei]AWI04884.1 AAA family ATPase [Clostridium drakei]
MEKKFNVTGICIPNKHYMVNTSNKIDKIVKLVKNEEYFIINRPRQYGKTTTLFLLEKTLNKNEDCFVIFISFEGIGDLIFEDETKFSKGFLNILKRTVELEDLELAAFIAKEKKTVENLDDLSSFITRLVKNLNKKVILMIDEVDKSSNNQLFLSFLGMLRNKYLLRNMGKDYTFHSVILAGVHDVKTLKVKIRPDEEHKYNSPWNIASDFDVDMSFSSKEIVTMLDEYVENKGVKLDKEYFSERLYYYTSGYPFLVSKLCKIIDEKIMQEDRLVWDKDYMDLAVKEILRESNTNFDSVIKNIENNSELKKLVKKIILDNDEVTYISDNPVINIGIIYGIFKNENNKVKVNNRIYEQRIYNYMSSLIETSVNIGYYNQKSAYIKEDGTLDIRRILVKFSEFMKHEYSEKREAFLEADGRLLFLAFISPIINGTGFAFKEVQGGEEKRFDIVVTYNKEMYILELKRWNGQEYHQKGLVQLGEYLEQYGLDEGYLLIFDFRKLNNELGKLKEATVTIGNRKKNIVEAYC